MMSSCRKEKVPQFLTYYKNIDFSTSFSLLLYREKIYNGQIALQNIVSPSFKSRPSKNFAIQFVFHSFDNVGAGHSDIVSPSFKSWPSKNFAIQFVFHSFNNVEAGHSDTTDLTRDNSTRETWRQGRPYPKALSLNFRAALFFFFYCAMLFSSKLLTFD